MKALVILAAAALVLAPVSAPAQESVPDSESRLGACLAAGAGGAPRDSLEHAVVALRSLCYAQIKRVLAARLRVVDARFGPPDAKLPPSRANARAEARAAETRRFNNEIAVTISNLTGLTP
jgi:hypothetical protein